MEYEEYYNGLWQEKARLAADQAGISQQLAQFDGVIAKSATVSQEQWLESLAVAGSFASAKFDWVTPEIQQQSETWVATIASHLVGVALEAGHPVLHASQFKEMCTLRVRPYFSPSSSRTTGYTLLGGDKGSKNAEALLEGSSEQKWKAYPQAVAAFTWALGHLDPRDITETISSILPVVMALIEDYDCQSKIHGLRLVRDLLTRGDHQFLCSSGISSVIDRGLGGCLVYRSEADELGIELLDNAFQAAILCSDIQFTDRSKPKYTEQWWALADRVISNSIYVADNVAASTVLCAQITTLCRRLEVAIARYLRPLVGIATRPLHSPAYLSASVCRLHQVAAEQLLALIRACPQRIGTYTGEILAALAYSWSSSDSSKHGGVDRCALDGLRQTVVSAVHALANIDEVTGAAVATAVQQLEAGRPSTSFSEWRN
ncbi:hypothetical protein GGF46_003760 [Coemansia sp. RSA 552]|nr:hypothetical protein GGF46_003760 [Coemansia sp. RSA 552]